MASADHSSFANLAEARVQHIELDWTVDFDRKTIRGTAALRVGPAPGAAPPARLVLDTKALDVQKVWQRSEAGSLERELQFSLSADAHPALGTALTISLAGTTAGSNVTVVVQYETTAASSALQWLSSTQTAGKKKPFLFSQCQAIHARSMLPCQDAPMAKSTYAAVVRVPPGMTALMSAVAQGSHAKPGTFAFSQAVPISPYLIALVVGDLASRDLDARCRVWAEPAVVDSAAHEFAETPSYLAAAEEIAGPYVWGRYDILVLPPSFPYGGMENPCLTFVTPTLLAGDRSQANVVAHEIAHSWTGNLVTNRTWQDFFLNEGCTVWLERSILGRLYGPPTRDFHIARGQQDLKDSVTLFGQDHNFTKLVPDLSGGIDPDDAFSSVPYEKGSSLLWHLQSLVGEEPFVAFFKRYVKHFSFGTVDAEGFRAFFLDSFSGNEAVKTVDWHRWFYAPGMPPVAPQIDDALATKPAALALRWHTADVLGLGLTSLPDGCSADDLRGWSAPQVVAVLQRLGEHRAMTPLSPSAARMLGEVYGLDASRNSEVRLAFYRLAIAAGDAAIVPAVVSFLKEQGRMKYLRPLYRALFKSAIGRTAALETFDAMKRSYHAIAAKMVAADLQVAPP